MRIIEKSSEQETLCGWSEKMLKQNIDLGMSQICVIPTNPITTTVVFKEAFRTKGGFPIFVKDDPDIITDTLTSKRGYSGNYVFDLFDYKTSVLTGLVETWNDPFPF